MNDSAIEELERQYVVNTRFAYTILFLMVVVFAFAIHVFLNASVIATTVEEKDFGIYEKLEIIDK